MPVNDVYQVDINTRFQENDNIYCFVYQVRTVVDETLIPGDLETYGELTIAPALLPIHIPGVVFRCVVVNQIWPNASIPTIESLLDAPGTRTFTKGLPGQCSAVVQIFGDTSDPTGRNRGRDYLYGQDVGDLAVAGNVWDAGYLTDVCTFYQVLDDGFTSPGGNVFELGVFSRMQAKENIDPQFVSNGGIVPDPDTFGDDFFNQVVLYRLQPLVRTQRRRQPLDPCLDLTNCDPLA